MHFLWSICGQNTGPRMGTLWMWAYGPFKVLYGMVKNIFKILLGWLLHFRVDEDGKLFCPKCNKKITGKCVKCNEVIAYGKYYCECSCGYRAHPDELAERLRREFLFIIFLVFLKMMGFAQTAKKCLIVTVCCVMPLLLAANWLIPYFCNAAEPVFISPIWIFSKEKILTFINKF